MDKNDMVQENKSVCPCCNRPMAEVPQEDKYLRIKVTKDAWSLYSETINDEKQVVNISFRE